MVVVSQVNSVHNAIPDPVLEWPDSLNVDVQNLCRKVLRTVAHGRRQELVDELAGRMAQGKVKQPVAYLGHLVRLDASQSGTGGLVLELAHDVRATRQAQKVNRQRLAAANAPSSQTLAPRDLEVKSSRVDVLKYREKLSQLSKEFKGKARLFTK